MWKIKERLYRKVGPKFEELEHIADLIYWTADDPAFTFHDPNDWPELPALTVEDVNRPHRGPSLVREATMERFDADYHINLYESARIAEWRMALVQAIRDNPEQIVRVSHVGIEGGYVPNDNQN